MAGALKATALFLLGPQFMLPSALHARVSARDQSGAGNREGRFAEVGNPKLPDDKLPDDLLSGFGHRCDQELQTVILQTAEPSALADRRLIHRRGRQVKQGFDSVVAMRAVMPLPRIAALAADAGLGFITPGRQVCGTFDATTGLVGSDDRRQAAQSADGYACAPVAGTGAERLALLARNDDTAIFDGAMFGVSYITGGGPLFPRQR